MEKSINKFAKELSSEQYQRFVELFVKHRPYALKYLNRIPSAFEQTLARNPAIFIDDVPFEWVSKEFYLEYVKHDKIKYIETLEALPDDVYTAVLTILVERQVYIDPLIIDVDKIEAKQLLYIIETALKYDYRFLSYAPRESCERLYDMVAAFDKSIVLVNDSEVVERRLTAQPELIEHVNFAFRKKFAHRYDAIYVLNYAVKYHQVSVVAPHIDLDDATKQAIDRLVVWDRVPPYDQRKYINEIIELIRYDSSQLFLVDRSKFADDEYARFVDAALEAQTLADSFGGRLLRELQLPNDFGILRNLVRRVPKILKEISSNDIGLLNLRILFGDAIEDNPRAIKYLYRSDLFNVERCDEIAKKLPPADFDAINRRLCSPAVYEELAMNAIKYDPHMLAHVDCKNYAQIAKAAIEIDENVIVIVDFDRIGDDDELLTLIKKKLEA